VVGADAKLYRCGLQVGSCLSLSEAGAGKSSDEKWWKSFDPMTLPTCSRCSFLPVCWGGCPKKHLEADRHAILEQGAYWRRNLAKLVTEGVEMTCNSSFSFGEADQFRNG